MSVVIEQPCSLDTNGDLWLPSLLNLSRKEVLRMDGEHIYLLLFSISPPTCSDPVGTSQPRALARALAPRDAVNSVRDAVHSTHPMETLLSRSTRRADNFMTPTPQKASLSKNGLPSTKPMNTYYQARDPLHATLYTPFCCTPMRGGTAPSAPHRAPQAMPAGNAQAAE